ncbi:MAG: DUF4442 domain-containing protein, partial [Bacteroidetes bacterium]|nr:DUF4442 domain-containing protein [Bacteroidota bacterium]
MMSSIRYYKGQLFLMGILKIRMVGFVRPRLLELNSERCRVRIPLRRRTRNHVGSMYLGAFAVGADLASGYLAYFLAKESRLSAMPVFKSMKAEYHRRAESAVIFTCADGALIQDMIENSRISGERENRVVTVLATCENEEVARF